MGITQGCQGASPASSSTEIDTKPVHTYKPKDPNQLGQVSYRNCAVLQSDEGLLSGSEQGVGQLGNEPYISFTLTMHPAALERQFWALRGRACLTGLDCVSESFAAMLWLTVLPRLQGSARLWGALWLVGLSVQLAVLLLAPKQWLQHRTVSISLMQLIRTCVWSPLQQAARVSRYSDLNSLVYCATSLLSCSHFGSHLVFVLFHQQSIMWQMPVLMVGTATAVYRSFSLPQQQHPWSSCLSITMPAKGLLDQLMCSMVSSSPPTLASMTTDDSRQSQAVALNAVVLFAHIYAGFVLPCYVAYMMEWHAKLDFFINSCQSKIAKAQQLTPAAAALRGHFCTATALHVAWLLVAAVVAWAVAITVSEIAMHIGML